MTKILINSFSLELTEFPKIDISDESADDDNDDETKKTNDSLSLDTLSLTNNSGMSNNQQTSDYESFADCMHQSPPIANAASLAIPLTNINLDNHFSIQSSIRVNGEGSSLSNDQQRKRKNGTSTTTTTLIRKNGKTTRVMTNNETPLLSHLFGTHKSNNDFNS